MKKLGFGLMRLPKTCAEDQKSIDIPQVIQMTDLFLERGFTYFDTAYMYHDGESERAVKKFLSGRIDREKFLLACTGAMPGGVLQLGLFVGLGNRGLFGLRRNGVELKVFVEFHDGSSFGILCIL